MLILIARYDLAENSIREAKPKRYRTVIDEYYNYINSYPSGKFIKEAEKYFKDAQEIVEVLPNS